LPFPPPMHESEKWKWSRSVVSDSSQSHGLQPTRLLRPWQEEHFHFLRPFSRQEYWSGLPLPSPVHSSRAHLWFLDRVGRRGRRPAWSRTTVIGSMVGMWPKSGQSKLIQFCLSCWGSCPVPFAIRLWSLSCCRQFIITREKRLDNGANPGAESRGASQQEQTGSQRHHWGPESQPCGQRYLQNFQKSQQMFSCFNRFEMCLQPAESRCRNFKWKCTYK